jgi:hypothetical protein
MHVHDRGVQDVARNAARCALHVQGRGAKADACGRSVAVLSTQVPTAGLRLRRNTLTCGSMLEVSRDAVAAREEQLDSCTAEQSKCCSICTATLDPCGNLPFTSWGRWQCLRGGADGLNSFYAACGCGTECRCRALPGETCGDTLEAIARVFPSQPNEAMARIAPRRNGTISLNPSCRVKIPEQGSLD